MSLNPSVATVDLIVADSSDLESLLKMVKMTRVVITTTGPFSMYGSDLVKLCAENGTHYCDITGR
jgi:short subunit dehydrogenase-like uncharacterized protein